MDSIKTKGSLSATAVTDVLSLVLASDASTFEIGAIIGGAGEGVGDILQVASYGSSSTVLIGDINSASLDRSTDCASSVTLAKNNASTTLAVTGTMRKLALLTVSSISGAGLPASPTTPTAILRVASDEGNSTMCV